MKHKIATLIGQKKILTCKIVIVFQALVIFFLLITTYSYSVSNDAAAPIVESQATEIATVQYQEDLFPPLDMPLEYFDGGSLNIGAGPYNTLVKNDQFYRSYPSTIITLGTDRYSNEVSELPPIKTDNQIHTEDPQADFMGVNKDISIQRYGDLARRFAGDPGIGVSVYDVGYADVDGDGKNETIVTIDEMGNNLMGQWSVIIKDDKIIFSTNENTFSLLTPAEDGNGFYLNWDDNYKKRDGYVITRFIHDGTKFVPVYEQIIRHIRLKSVPEDAEI